MHGSQQSARTNWQLWAGFTLAHLSNGTTRFFPEGISIDSIIKKLTKSEVSTANYLKNQALALKNMAYPSRPIDAELYLHDWGYEKPVELGEWEWSTDFGRWGRIVKFADGWHGYTFPKP